MADAVTRSCESAVLIIAASMAAKNSPAKTIGNIESTILIYTVSPAVVLKSSLK
ncbi:hypothetical protein SDC9_95341 [bioreactor metagenome]|uniref:Uncharacterized protein n=1 Tax=bioreactor metagenome TaxID=1076179 RepID=A0A645A609_9ZZZZ